MKNKRGSLKTKLSFYFVRERNLFFNIKRHFLFHREWTQKNIIFCKFLQAWKNDVPFLCLTNNTLSDYNLKMKNLIMNAVKYFPSKKNHVAYICSIIHLDN